MIYDSNLIISSWLADSLSRNIFYLIIRYLLIFLQHAINKEFAPPVF